MEVVFTIQCCFRSEWEPVLNCLPVPILDLRPTSTHTVLPSRENITIHAGFAVGTWALALLRA